MFYKRTQDPFKISLNTEIIIDIYQSDNINRNEFLNLENLITARVNEAEVTYYRGNLSGVQLQNSQNKNLEVESANYLSNFLGEEMLEQLIDVLDKKVRVPAFSVVSSLSDYYDGKHELEQQINIGKAKSVANSLKMEIQISDRFTPRPGSNEYIIQLNPTNNTFNLLDRWKEVKNINPNIPYPQKAIQNQDWEEIAKFLSGNEAIFEEINPELSDYIINNDKKDDKSVEDIAK